MIARTHRLVVPDNGRIVESGMQGWLQLWRRQYGQFTPELLDVVAKYGPLRAGT